MPEINSMQANLGLIPGTGSPVGFHTPSSAETSLQLMQQASQRREMSRQAIVATSVGEQYRQQLSQIQSQQSISPYGAQMLAGHMPGAQGYGQGYMPSPLTMTPPSTGVFRPPSPPGMTPMAPMHRPPIPFTPFQPRLPEPMFQSAYDQQAQLSDMRQNQMFSYASQAPGVAAQGAGIAAGAYAGARMGARFGRYGRVAGAIGGAALAGFSGVAGGMRDLAQTFMQPAIETRQLGAGIQNMSRNWVVQGPQMHAMGRGLTRDASIEMAEEVRNLSGEDRFQEQTGEMFNRQDLMKIMGQGGKAGLFDMAQSVPQIKQQLRQTSITIKQFMELTNNPDVTSVIRDMGRLRQFGMSQQEMVEAAQGMKAYSRAAGTTISGLQQIGGLPGAMAFQQAGLTAGTGFRYGNFAAASARQLVASGDINARQLSLLGGVQGIAQRDIQAQAAFSSMPMFAAMNAQFSGGQWGVNQGARGQAGQGAFGMVQGSLQALNQAVRQGGLGALAQFPLEQRRIADEATAAMTPEQQMAQRFEMAMTTGQRLGLKGQGAFAAGARTMYGDEVAEQMMVQARSPGFWRGQQQQIQRRQRELASETRQRIEEESPWMGGAPREAGKLFMKYTPHGMAISGIGEAAERIGEEFSSTKRSVFTRAWESFQDREAMRTQGTYRRRYGVSAGRIGRGMSEAGKGAFAGLIESQEEYANLPGTTVISEAALVNAENLETGGGLKWGATLAEGIIGTPLRLAGDIFGLKPDVGAAVAGASAALSTAGMTDQDKARMVGSYIRQATTTLETIDRAKEVGGVTKNVTNAAMAIEGAFRGSKGKGEGLNILQRAGNKLDKLVYDRGDYGKQVTSADYRRILKETIKSQGGVSSKEAERITAELMSKSQVQSEINTQMTHYAKIESRDPSTWLGAQEQDPRAATYDQIQTQTEARIGTLKKAQVALEKTLGVEESEVAGGWFEEGSVLAWMADPSGMLGITSGYSAEEVKIHGLAAAMGGEKFAATAAGLEALTGEGDERDRTKWEAIVKKRGWTIKQRQEEEARIRALARRDEDVAERIREMSRKGTSKQLAKYATGIQARGMQTAFASPGFMEEYGKYSGTLEDYLATDTGVVTAAGVAEQFTAEDRARLAKTGGQQGRVMAALLEKADAGDKKAQEQLLQIAKEKQQLSEEGVEEVVTTKPEGAEAQKLAASKEALENVSALFKDFAPATKDFKEAAEMFLDAMEAGEIIKVKD